MNFNFKAIKSTGLFSGIKKMLDTNAPTVATFGSVLSLGLTMFFMHKASKAAAKVSEKYDEQLAELEIYRVDDDEDKTVEDGAIDESEYKTEKARIKMNKALSLVWVYRRAIFTGIVSGGLAFLSNFLNGRNIATLAGALALSHERLKEYMIKGKELLGDEKFAQMRDEINSELFHEQVLKGETKIERCDVKTDGEESDDGAVIFSVPRFGWLLEISENQVRDAIAEAERMEYLTLSDFRNLLGLPWSKIGNDYEWKPVYTPVYENGKLITNKVAEDSKFKAHPGYDPTIGKYGCKAIIFDNEPSFNAMGK